MAALVHYGTSGALLLWSAAILASGRLARAAGVAGAIAGSAVLLGVLSGHLRLNVHGFGVVTLAQSLWLVWAGRSSLLSRRAGADASQR